MESNNSNLPNLEQLMQLGIQTARQGNKQNARMIFQQILDADRQNERAWLWMASVAETSEDRAQCLNTVLHINPNNQAAQRELNNLKKKHASSNSQVLLYGGFALALVIILIAVVIFLLTGI